MDRREVEVGKLQRGDNCWFDGHEWCVEHNAGRRLVHIANHRSHDYIEPDTVVEVPIY